MSGVASGGATFDSVKGPRRHRSSPLGDHSPCYGVGDRDTVCELHPNNQPFAHQSPSRQNEHSPQGDEMKFPVVSILLAIATIVAVFVPVDKGKIQQSFQDGENMVARMKEMNVSGAIREAGEAYRMCLKQRKEDKTLTCHQPTFTGLGQASSSSTFSATVAQASTSQDGPQKNVYPDMFACTNYEEKDKGIASSKVTEVNSLTRYQMMSGCTVIKPTQAVTSVVGEKSLVEVLGQGSISCRDNACLSFINGHLNETLVVVNQNGGYLKINH